MVLVSRMNMRNPLNQLCGEVDRLFEGFFREDLTRVRPPAGSPALNVWQDEQSLFVEAELPGLKIGDINVSIVDGELTIKGERSEEDAGDLVFHRRECSRLSFSRTVRLPVKIDAGRVEAVLENGVLTVTLPKAEEVMPKKIEVKTA